MKSKLRRFPAANAWERAWQKHWSKVGLPGYELPVGGPGGDEREFLALARTPEKERARLKRINDEFIRGFKGLFRVGPMRINIFGAAGGEVRVVLTHGEDERREALAQRIQQRFRLKSGLPGLGDTIEL